VADSVAVEDAPPFALTGECEGVQLNGVKADKFDRRH
jgi:hypothetical protein